jgi:hypothetical protein
MELPKLPEGSQVYIPVSHRGLAREVRRGLREREQRNNLRRSPSGWRGWVPGRTNPARVYWTPRLGGRKRSSNGFALTCRAHRPGLSATDVKA